jgi:uncharacterized membrane-anchored protein YjiN (DUF445 family)
MVSKLHTFNKADRVLCTAFILFICALVLKHYYPDVFLFKALFVGMEAALVGGIADWFAVTALFRRPLGFPWHTALIPNNRAKLIEATADMVQHEFFSREKLKELLQNVRLVDVLIGWLESQQGKQIFAATASRCIGDMISKVDPKFVAESLEQLMRTSAGMIKLAPALQSLCKWVLDNRKDEQFLDSILRQITETAEKASARQAIYEYLRQYKEEQSSGFLGAIVNWVGERTNAVNIDDMADSLHQELIGLLKELSQPSHPLRMWIHQRTEDMAGEITGDPAWSKAVEAWKDGVIRKSTLQQSFMDLINMLAKEIQGPGEPLESTSDRSMLTTWILGAMDKYWEAFRQDRALQDWVEGYLQEAAQRIIDSEHDIIGTVVKDAMQVLSDKELNRLIESKTGEDLQWIRINGSLVGGVAGLVVFLVLHVAWN